MIGVLLGIWPATAAENANAGHGSDDVSLTCEFERSSDKLSLRYNISQRSAADVYVLDNPDLDIPYVFWGGSVTAYILEGISPVPTHEILVRLIPSASKVSLEEHLERTLEMTLPLIEHGAYDRITSIANYDRVPINDLRFVVQYLRSTAVSFGVEQYGKAYRVWSENTVGQAESLECRQRLDELVLLKSRDTTFRRWGAETNDPR
jgi:hypothetical protein